jgi:hypothetical protein
MVLLVGLLLFVGGLIVLAWYARTPDYACRRFTRAFLAHDVKTMVAMLDYDFHPDLGRKGAKWAGPGFVDTSIVWM